MIVCGEGIVDESGCELGAQQRSTDPAGNIVLSGASEALRDRLIEAMGDDYFREARRANSASEAIFTRKIGHTQRGGRPLPFDRFYAAQLGGKAVDMLFAGQNNARRHPAVEQRSAGFHVDSINGHAFRDRWGHIHAALRASVVLRSGQRCSPRDWASSTCCRSSPTPSAPTTWSIRGRRCSTRAILFRPYHSVNTDINKRIRFLDDCR